ncbi:MAG: hypothetical protein HYZ22_07385 [Chloroflexi bacterium]|nr:hypothetical protein [Chloroflexota bacterium]
MISPENNERRDWTLLIFIIPIGIILIILVGQLAVRLVPIWSVNADMNSNLEPDPASARPFALLEPILPQILTPMAWAQTYLTPGADISFPPFLTFEPTATPSPTVATSTETAETPTPTATTPSPVPTGVTATPTPPSGGGDGGGGSATCTDPAADNYGGALPCTYPPTTCTDPAADNFGGALPCDYTSTTTCTDTVADNYGGPLPCVYPITSTPDPSYTFVDPPPSELGVGTLPDNTDPGGSDVGDIVSGTYIVVALNVIVESTPDNNYDLVFYEYDYNNAGYILLDWIIVGISNDSNGSNYYEVFNWGDGNPDTNSSVGDVAQTAGGEADNESIPTSELYDPDDAGAAPQTGILIDVDEAGSNPPAGEYQFVVFISPSGGNGDASQVDAVQTIEVPTPTP